MPAQRSVARTGLLLAAVLALCRIASLGKELLVAGRFGAGDSIDAYALALLVPALALALYLSAVRRGYLVEAPRRVDTADLASFTNRYLAQVLLFSAGLALLAWWLLPYAWPLLLAPDRYQSLGKELARLNVPIALLILPTAAVSALTAVLNARHSFASPQWTHVLPTAAIVAAVLLGDTSQGAALLAWGLLLGSCVQAVVLARLVHRAGHRFRAGDGSPLRGAAGFVAVVLPFLWMDAIGQLNVLVDRGMAGDLPAGRLSILYWAALGKDFLSGTLIASMLWVLLPRFAEQVAAGDHDGLRHGCSRLVRFAAVLLLPVSALVLLAGYTLLGELSLDALAQEDCRRLGITLGGYAWGLFPELAGLALVQAVLVLGRFRQLAVIGLLGLLLPNLLLNLLLIGPFKELGLALSTSATAWLLLGVAAWAVDRSIGLENPRGIAASVLRAFAFSTLAGLGGWGLDAWLGSGPAAAVTAIGFATLAYLGLALGWPGHPDAQEALRTWRRRDGHDHHDHHDDLENHDGQDTPTRSVPS